MNQKKIETIIKNAYRKLKSFAYFDKSQSFLKDQIIDFENEVSSIEDRLRKIALIIVNKKRYNEINDLISKIDCRFLPKKVSNETASELINCNFSLSDCVIEEYQSFFIAPIEIHLVGFLWAMTIGREVDSSLSDDLFGNRIRNNFRSEDASCGPSPYLMKPYFEQYETWRDKGLNLLESELKNNKEGVMINLDLRRYYYNVDLTKFGFEDKLSKYNADILDSCEISSSDLNALIIKIMKVYTNKLKEYDETIKSECLLPIGFFPSSILANLYLIDFDNDIKSTKPIYYGRYVDDILIVYSSCKKNFIMDLNMNEDNVNKIIKILNYLYCSNTQCSNTRWNISNEEIKDDKKGEQKEKLICFNVSNGEKLNFSYTKTKIFYFKPQYSYKMIEEFKEHIWKNKSEFRLIPEGLFEVDYHRLTEDIDTIKIDGVRKNRINKFEFSKFIGKHLYTIKEMKIKPTNKALDDLDNLIDDALILENHIMWESLLSLYILADRLDLMASLTDRIFKLIHNPSTTNCIVMLKKKFNESLYDHFRISLARSLSVLAFSDSSILFKEYLALENKNKYNKLISYLNSQSPLFRKFNMTNKSFFFIPPSTLDEKEIMKGIDSKVIRLYEFDNNLEYLNMNMNIVKEISKSQDRKYSIRINESYYLMPYNISLLEIQMIKLFLRLINSSWITKPKEFDAMSGIWLPINGYRESKDLTGFIRYKDKEVLISKEGKNNICKRIFEYDEDKSFKSCLVGVGNVRINNIDTYFDDVRSGKPNITQDSFNNLSDSINTVLKFRGKDGSRTNLFVLPETHVPILWLPNLVSISKKNDMAIITGLEHIKYKNKNGNEEYYNFIVSIFPVKIKDFTFVNVNFHLKVHYSPVEIKEFNQKVICGNIYEMHKWRGLNIAPYCCYELTSIVDRIIFREDDINAIAAIVFNKDVTYFSNIVESLGRDLNSFVIQANDSKYGDSRIFQPARGPEKNLMRFSGGINHTALISEIEIASLKYHLTRPILVQENNKKWKIRSPK